MAGNNLSRMSTHSSVKLVQLIWISVVQIVLQLGDEMEKLLDSSVAAFPTKALISK
jgi:hypothetical protein